MEALGGRCQAACVDYRDEIPQMSQLHNRDPCLRSMPPSLQSLIQPGNDHIGSLSPHFRTPEGFIVMTAHTHQTAPTQFVATNGIRFAYRR